MLIESQIPEVVHNPIQISIVIPAFNEDESIPKLCDWIKLVMMANSFSYEVIMVDDGSTDNTWEVIKKISSGR